MEFKFVVIILKSKIHIFNLTNRPRVESYFQIIFKNQIMKNCFEKLICGRSESVDVFFVSNLKFHSTCGFWNVIFNFNLKFIVNKV